jgi:sporulation protein YqfC
MGKQKKISAVKAKAYNLVKAMQLPSGLVPNSTHFEINSNREAVIEGYKGILEYTEEKTKINLGKMIVIFSGRKIVLKYQTADSLILEGFFSSIEFVT